MSAFSQIEAQMTDTLTLLKLSNTFIQQRIEGSDPEGWLFFKNSSDLEPGQLFTEHPTESGLSANDSMALFKSVADDDGRTHNRYQQYYKNLKVEGGEVFEHVKNCYVYLLHGRIIEGLDMSSTPTYNEAQSLNFALDSIDASEYAWENTDWEQQLQEDAEDSTATYYPTGTLLWTYLPGTELEEDNYVLAWKFEILAVDPFHQQIIYVDASTGEIFKSLPVDCHNGPAATPYDGIQTIDTKWAGGLFHGHHHLIADDNGKRIATKGGTYSVFNSWNQHVWDNDDNWGFDTPTRRMTGAHWVVSRSWDFFKDIYNRNGPANNNSDVMRVYGNSNLANNAKYWKSDSQQGVHYIELGTSNSSHPAGIPSGTSYAALDIAGHEFTHSITKHEANFVYEGESGALDESFADIFGLMIERYARGGTFNWTILEDLGYVSRDLQTPANSFTPQPQTYLTDPLWFTTAGCVVVDTNDFCGVHTNSGVQNRWFYLLSEGGTQNGVTVQGIGVDKAARIAYVNLTTYLGSNANHPSARLGAIAAAKALFGDCSNELIQTTNAWSAVGVGTQYSGTCLTLDGPIKMCTTSFAYGYQAQAPAGASLAWTYPPEWTGSLSGPGNSVLTISSFGTYVPLGGYPAFEFIGVSSSLGGTVYLEVVIYDDCLYLCDGSGTFRGAQVSSVSEPANVRADIYPNPTQSQLNVSCSGDSPKQISLFSTLGDKLMDIVPTQNNHTLDVSALPNGVYFVSVQFVNQTITKMFTKSN
jgi:Zn-dependent metalloprotease